MATGTAPRDPPDRPSADTAEGRQLIVAMELLARAIDKSTTATLDNVKAYSQPRTRAGGRAADPDAKLPLAKEIKEPRHESEVYAERQRARQAAANLENYVAFMRRKRAGEGVGEYDRRRDYRPAEPRGGGAGADAGRALAGAAAGLLKLVGPAAVLAAVLQSNASGIELLSKGTRLLAAVFAPVLLPAVVIVAAAMLGLSDMLWKNLTPAMALWFRLIITVGVPILDLFFESVRLTAGLFATLANNMILLGNVVIDVANKLGKVIGINEQIPRIALPPGLQKVIDALDPMQQGKRTPEAKERQRLEAIREENDRFNARRTEIFEAEKKERMARGMTREQAEVGLAQLADQRARDERRRRLMERGVVDENDPAMAGGGFKAPNVKRLMEEVTKSLEFSAGPKASIGDLGAPRSAAQLAVFGDPFEKRIEQMFLQTIGLLKQVVAELPEGQQPVMGNR